DGDFCTDDVCDPATGCSHPAVTGLRRSSWVDALRALLASVPGDLGNLSRRLLVQLDRVDRALARAQAAGRPKRRARRSRKRAGSRAPSSGRCATAPAWAARSSASFSTTPGPRWRWRASRRHDRQSAFVGGVRSQAITCVTPEARNAHALLMADMRASDSV